MIDDERSRDIAAMAPLDAHDPTCRFRTGIAGSPMLARCNCPVLTDHPEYEEPSS